MTRSRSSFIYILLVAIVCFAAGMASVLLREDIFGSRQEQYQIETRAPRDPSPESTPGARSISIVVFGVDDLSLEKPQLQALWFASFEPPQKQIQLLGISVDASISESGVTLRENFSLFEPPDFGAGFLTALTTLAPHPIHGFIVLDEEGFAALIDYIGGVTLDDQQLSGAAAVGALSLLSDQPSASLRMQRRLITSLAMNAESIGNTPELTPLTTLVPDHAYTSPSPYELASLGSQLLPIDPTLVSVEIRTNE